MKNYGVWFGSNHGKHGFIEQYALTVQAFSKKQALEIAKNILYTCSIEDLKTYAISDYDKLICEEARKRRYFDFYNFRIEIL